jgi:hypothetical protein
MFFNNGGVSLVKRLNHKLNIFDDVKVKDYRTIATAKLHQGNSETVFKDFYNILKKKNRIINGSFSFLPDIILQCYNRLIDDCGYSPNIIYYSNISCYEKCNSSSLFEESVRNKNLYERVLVDKCFDKPFIVLSNQNYSNIGLNYKYDHRTNQFVLEEPIYDSDDYNDSHYDFFYGIKLYE